MKCALLTKRWSKSSVGVPGGVQMSRLNGDRIGEAKFNSVAKSSSKRSASLVGECWLK